MDSQLVAHAKTELELLGEDPEFMQGYLNVIQAFADMGHSGGSASVAIPVINKLLRYKNLTPLTDNPIEWIYHSKDISPPDGVWQSKRDFSCFSYDGGKSYYSLEDEKAETKFSQPFNNIL